MNSLAADKIGSYIAEVVMENMDEDGVYFNTKKANTKVSEAAVEAIAEHLSPEDVFTKDDLIKWAESNNFVNKDLFI